MYTICHQMLTIASASGAPPVLPRPNCGSYYVHYIGLLLAFTQSLAIAASCVQLPQSDIRVSFLVCNPRLHGHQEEFLKGMGQSLKLLTSGLARMPIKLIQVSIF